MCGLHVSEHMGQCVWIVLFLFWASKCVNHHGVVSLSGMWDGAIQSSGYVTFGIRFTTISLNCSQYSFCWDSVKYNSNKMNVNQNHTYILPFGRLGFSKVMLMFSLGSCLTEVMMGAVPGTPEIHFVIKILTVKWIFQKLTISSSPSGRVCICCDGWDWCEQWTILNW